MSKVGMTQKVYNDIWSLDFSSMSWTDDVLHTLTGAMSLLRRCRVNAALTIQLFSQLFHFINMWLFNRLVTDPDSGLCSHYWGAIIRQQLGHIEAWAEKQGLELAADCHLSRIVQVCTRLYSILCASPSSLLMYWRWISDFIMDKNLGSVKPQSFSRHVDSGKILAAVTKQLKLNVIAGIYCLPLLEARARNHGASCVSTFWGTVTDLFYHPLLAYTQRRLLLDSFAVVFVWHSWVHVCPSVWFVQEYQ